MPSFLNKILHPSASSSSRNPYAAPNHARTTPLSPPSTTAPRTFEAGAQAQRGLLRPASPREQRDYLAEAREVVGRDPVTGRPVYRTQHQQTSHTQPLSRGGITDREDGDRVEREEGWSVYQETNAERAARGQGASGTKYDLFVQEMQARKVGRWRAPEGGFYAPGR